MKEEIVKFAEEHLLGFVGLILGMVLFVAFVGYGIQNIVFPWIGGW